MTPQNSIPNPASRADGPEPAENAPTATAKRGEGHVEDAPKLVADLHAQFCRWSKMPLRLRPEFQRLWWDLYVDRGRDLAALRDEIRIVCVYLRSQIERDKRNPGALRLANLLQPDQFESDVAEALMMRGKGAAKIAESAGKKTPSVPPGWRAWLEDQYPNHAPDYRDRPFTDLPGELQNICRKALQS